MSESLSYKTSSIKFNDKTYSDIKFVFDRPADSEVVYAHGTVLLIECPKLFDLGRECGPFGSSTVLIKGIHAKVFIQFLKFIYLGVFDRDTRTYAELLYLAKEFSLTDLEKQIHVCLRNISVENAAEALQIAINLKLPVIKRKAMQYIGDNFSNVLVSDSILRIRPRVLVDILKSDRVCEKYNGEMEVFEAIRRYVDTNFDPGSTKYEYCLEKLIKFVRFPTMSKTKFARFVAINKAILSSNEISEIFIEIGCGPPNQYGYSNFKRRYEKIIDPDHVNQTTEVSIDSTNFLLNGQIPTTKTIFSLNQPIVIREVFVAGAIGVDCQVEICLMNNNGKTLARGSETIYERYDDLDPPERVEMQPLIELQPFKNYILELDYKVLRKVEHIRYNKGIKMPLTINIDDLTVVFEQLNPMIHSFDVKEL